MIDDKTAAYGALLLRVSLGILFLAHAGLKIFVFGLAGAAGFFQSIGLPGGLVYLVTAAEVAGGAALLLGFYARYAALALLPLILGTIVTVHGAKGWVFSNPGGGWEYPAFWAVALIVQFLLGDGAAALRPARPLGTP